MALLEVSQLNVKYNNNHILKNLNINVEKNKVVAIIGKNGSGKTSFLNTTIGKFRPSSGTIIFSNEIIHGLRTHKIVSKGLVLVPERRELFPNLTVQDNLLAGKYSNGGFFLNKNLPNDLINKFPIIKNYLYTPSAALSGGQAQLIALARGLISKPKLLLLDEPTLGLSPIAVKDFFDLIVKLREEGQTILLVDQNIKITLDVADYVYVLEKGEIVLEGSAIELIKDKNFVKNYLNNRYDYSM
tara:strand:+ start:87 stop:815 length:729 start_codon:yes stop_codon:yes gene_type:complete